MKFLERLFVNPLIQKVLESNVRHALVWASGFLVAYALTDQAGAEKIVADLTPVVIAGIWALYSLIHEEKVKGAALLPGVETKAQAEALAKLPEAPKASMAKHTSAREISPLNVTDVPDKAA